MSCSFGYLHIWVTVFIFNCLNRLFGRAPSWSTCRIFSWIKCFVPFDGFCCYGGPSWKRLVIFRCCCRIFNSNSFDNLWAFTVSVIWSWKYFPNYLLPTYTNKTHPSLKIFTGKNCGLLNLLQEFIKIEVWLLLNFFIWLHNQLISIHSIVT